MPAPRVSRPIWKPELWVLTALSAVAHGWRLFTPLALAFDEQYYEKISGHYLDGTHYFDGHPPLAKLLYGAVGKLAGSSAEAMLGPESVVVLRILPAAMGTLFVPLVYIILRQLGAARQVATLGAVAVLCENALLVDSRFALIEPVMIGFGLIAIALFLAARSRSGVARWAFLVASAVAAGCAISSKWTGASALGLILAAWAWDARHPAEPYVAVAPQGRLREGRSAVRGVVTEGAVLSIIPVVVYVAVFAIHFSLITKTGTEMAILSRRYKATLIGTPEYDPAARMSMFAKIAEAHAAMRRGNIAFENRSHEAASAWYTWPIMKHPIGFWQDANLPRGQTANIALLGNPVVWWGGLVVIGLTAIAALTRRDAFASHGFPLAFLGGGYVINFAPFIAIQRLMFLYHYLFAVVFLAMFAAYAGGVLAKWQTASDDRLFDFPSRTSATIYWAATALIVAGFVYFLPLSYGWTLSQAAFDRRFWVLNPF